MYTLSLNQKLVTLHVRHEEIIFTLLQKFKYDPFNEQSYFEKITIYIPKKLTKYMLLKIWNQN